MTREKCKRTCCYIVSYCECLCFELCPDDTPPSLNFFILFCRYARHLQSQGKLLGLDEYNTNHIGGIPGKLSKGGPGEEAFSHAVEIARRKLHDVLVS